MYDVGNQPIIGLYRAYMEAYAWKICNNDAFMFAEKIAHCFHLNVWWIVGTYMHSSWNYPMFSQVIHSRHISLDN